MSFAGYIETTICRAGAELIVLDDQDVSPITRCVMQMAAQIERELASQSTYAACDEGASDRQTAEEENDPRRHRL
ncbi:MAG TPA: hypothetical protein VJ901_10600 [Thermoanaerobaculia bacterium]|nr:hypothetical protein [Thermoanaerobaculia bacterium]